MQVFKFKNVRSTQDTLRHDDFKVFIDDVLFLIRQLFESSKDKIDFLIRQIVAHGL